MGRDKLEEGEMKRKNYIYAYYQGIKDGSIVVGRWVRLVYEYLVTSLENKAFSFDQKKANAAIEWIEAHCFHTEGPLAPGPLRLELYQQANARLHRQGQQKPVIVHRLLVHLGASGEAGPRASSPAEPPDAHDRAQRQAWGPSMDEDVAKALEGKDETQAALVEALKARIGRWKG